MKENSKSGDRYFKQILKPFQTQGREKKQKKIRDQIFGQENWYTKF